MNKLLWLDKSERRTTLIDLPGSIDFLNSTIKDLEGIDSIAIHYTDLIIDSNRYSYSDDEKDKINQLITLIKDSKSNFNILIYSGLANTTSSTDIIKIKIDKIFKNKIFDNLNIKCGFTGSESDANFIKNHFTSSTKEERDKKILEEKIVTEKNIAIELVSQVVNFLHIENLDFSSPSYQWWRKLKDTFSDSGDSLVDALAEQIVKNEVKIKLVDAHAEQTVKNGVKVSVKQRCEESRQNDLVRWVKAGLIHLSKDGDTR